MSDKCADASVTKTGGHAMVEVRLQGNMHYTAIRDMTSLEAEEFARELREAAHKARQANVKPTKFGDH